MPSYTCIPVVIVLFAGIFYSCTNIVHQFYQYFLVSRFTEWRGFKASCKVNVAIDWSCMDLSVLSDLLVDGDARKEGAENIRMEHRV
jgi:hypothetical protein